MARPSNDGTPTPPLVVGAVLLAAGSGSRMGHRPKSLLQLNGVPLIRHQLNALSLAGVAKVVVVLGHHAERIKPLVQDLPATLVCNPDPASDQVASQRLGLNALPEPLDAVLVALADQPLINAQDIDALIGAYQKRPQGAQVVVPTVGGLPGNPVMFSNRVRTDILAGGANQGCRQWQAAHPDAVYRWETDNPHYRIDVDTPEDIEALARQNGLHLRWPE
jgi:molybdenum cofactor cytidylyltransferase